MYKKQRETKTVKNRKITINLSDDECTALAMIAGQHDLAASDIISKFVGDLADGLHTDGVVSRSNLDNWFSRTSYGGYTGTSLLAYLINSGSIDPECFLYYFDSVDKAKKEKKELKKANITDKDRLKELSDTISTGHRMMAYYYDDFFDGKEKDIKKEINLIRAWVHDRNDMLGPDAYKQ